MISKIRCFNPGHEISVLLGAENYTPSSNVQKMVRDLSCLPVWYSLSSDLVLVNELVSPDFISSLPNELGPFARLVTENELKDSDTSSLMLEADPWGISPHSLHLFEALKHRCNLNVSIPVWKEEYLRLTGRQSAAECLELVRRQLPGMHIPSAPVLCQSIEEVEKRLLQQESPFVVKMPYSSSGRGLLWLSGGSLTDKDRRWIEGAIKKQGMVTIEYALDKVQDIAAEFYSDGQGNVTYEGLSVFGTTQRGAYEGNILGSQDYLMGVIGSWKGEKVYQQMLHALTNALTVLYGNVYRGHLGVDMLVYKDMDGGYAIHPCLEINMRYTMGMFSLHLCRSYIDSQSIGEFKITYESVDGEAYDCHCRMKETYPVTLRDGKIQKGYLSLCPVTKDTKFRAYINVREK